MASQGKQIFIYMLILNQVSDTINISYDYVLSLYASKIRSSNMKYEPDDLVIAPYIVIGCKVHLKRVVGF